MATQQAVPVTCPTCRNQFSAPIFPLINGEDLPMKSAFLQGRVNMAQCPSCGWVGGLNVPFLYYDMSKEFAFVFVPNALQMGPGEQDKIVGNLTNTLVNSLPTEQRKFYLLNPQLYLTLESLVKAVLEKDGITEEMIQAQEARSKLIEEFLQIADEATLKTKAEENDELLDREFFEILTAMMQASQHRGDQNAAQALFALRSLLARWSTQGKEAVAEIDAELGLIYVQNQEELLERLKAAETGEEFEGLIAAAYSLLDYGFFQKLTEKIDAATQDGEKAEAETLT
ncbi:MAG: CpXC domain-containing protein, partial [Chloroflexota bacterium]